ncbi:NAD(P)-dependent oxidoreductase [Ottowia testudinis]|uniref:Hydroxyacid dehydrogenase n=1 Tax=Ottowia testudinis TaxID=2816950 RepID=A0A975CFS4_9BURK|nr:NAD(P)-dependent oxidoreductase [Ottowia testudinis]QTD44276.1 hydroxyacid dehydrogenase [Ottowia testudinis]
MNILLLEDLASDARQWLAARHQVDYRPELLDAPSLLDAQLHEVDALVAPPSLKINRQLLEGAPRLVAVGRIHDGTENIDFEACQKRRVRVIQASSATVRASAEHQLSALLRLFRATGQPLAPAPGPRGWPGREINDSVIGLFGMSPPAHVLATMLVPLGVRVVGYDPAVHRNADLWRRLGVQPMAMNEMLEIADAVAMQTIYASRYRGLVGERVLASCKPGQLWTSISRPSLFDLTALADAVESGRIGAFWMDSDDEQLSAPDLPLRQLPGVRITPRLAPFTQESQLRGSWYLADRIHETLAMAETRGQAGPLDSEPMPLA